MNRRYRRRPAGAGRLGAALVVATLAAGCASDADDPAAFCDAAPSIQVVTSEEELVGPAGPRRVEELRSQLAALHEAAPSDIRDDVGIMVGVIERLQAALAAEAGADEDARAETADALRGQLEAFRGASDRVVAYTRRICNVNLTGE